MKGCRKDIAIGRMEMGYWDNSAGKSFYDLFIFSLFGATSLSSGVLCVIGMVVF